MFYSHNNVNIFPSFVLCFLFFCIITTLNSYNSLASAHITLKQGSSLSVEKPNDFLISPNGTFTAGFHQVGDNSYCLAIWFSEPSCPVSCTVVWMANRDKPVNGKRSKLSLLRTGNLVLTDAGYSVTWSTKTGFSHSPVFLRLLETGNLVLGTETGFVLWQSFDSPTDTILPLQTFTKDMILVSSRSRTNISSGFYSFSFDDGNILRLVYHDSDTSTAFWPHPWLLPREAGRTTYNSSKVALLDSLGKFTSSDSMNFFAADYGVVTQRRLTLDFDGNLRLYSREQTSESIWVISWQVFPDSCNIQGICGPNSVCSYLPGFGRSCSCLPGFSWKKPNDLSLGCKPQFDSSCADENDATYIQLPHVESYNNDLGFYKVTTLERCKEICSRRCDCKGFVFKFSYQNNPDNVPYCFPKMKLINTYRSPAFRGVLYLKVPKTSGFCESLKVNASLNCAAEAPKQLLDRNYEKKNQNGSLKILLSFVVGLGVIEVLGICFVRLVLIRTGHKTDAKIEAMLIPDIGFRSFTYAELKRATRNFKEEIGRGASGIVFRGVLSNGQVAAIKQLQESEQGEAEFLAEVSTIGRLNHMHLIDMWGYCAEGKHRLLVYEYMENGSLAQNLYSRSLDWGKRFQIAVGTAKGLAYLHEECLEWILHCDLKPENILLDSEYQPKVCDFGLSKLINRAGYKGSRFSRIRGTRGYMAPDWIYCHDITSKVDVYSYGVVLLEMITGKRPTGSNAEQGRLVSWVRENMYIFAAKGESWIQNIVDPMIISTFDMVKIQVMFNVAMKCVEEDMNARPNMSQVAQMLLDHE